MQRILIVKLSALGDVIQTLPVLAALRRGHPQLHIDWVVEEEIAPLLEGHLLIDRLLPLPRRRILKSLYSSKNLSGAFHLLRRFWKELRRENYDVILDLQGLLKSALVTLAARAPRKIGFANGREGSPLVLNEKLPPYPPDLHAVKRYLLAAEYLGGLPEPVEFPLPPFPSAEEVARKLALPSPPWLIFIPATRWPTKLWPSENWRKLVELACDSGLPLIATGTSQERAYVSQCVGEKVYNLAGRLSLPELAGILSGAQAVVSVDTGPMHLAAALGRPVVALFGPTAPWRTGPFGKIHRVLRLELPCSPCFRKRCPEPRCLQGLSPEKVWQTLKEVLGNSRA